jgi:predicted amidophosphoribosyltransferase
LSKYAELGKTKYGIDFLYQRKRPVPFLDHYHSAGNVDFEESVRVQHAFKDGNPIAVEFFAPIMARIVAHEFGGRPTHVVPTLGSTDRRTDTDCATFKLAEAISVALGVPLDIDSFYQVADRAKLHLGGRPRSREEREQIVRQVLRRRGNIAGRSYLVVDDIFTTGATMTVYAELMEAAGATLAGGAALFRYEDSLQLLNPALFRTIAKDL